MEGRHDVINFMTAASYYYDWEGSLFFKERGSLIQGDPIE